MRLILITMMICISWISDLSSQTSYTAYIFMAEECPVCNYLGKNLKRLSSEYQDDVRFVAVFPQRMSNYKTVSLFLKKYDLEHFDSEIDFGQSITKKYNASVTPEVVLVDDSDNILYQGRINNSYAAPGRMRHGKVREDLEIAIRLALQGKEISKPWPDPIGCYITKI